jgi:hypothetical protein
MFSVRLRPARARPEAARSKRIDEAATARLSSVARIDVSPQ